MQNSPQNIESAYQEVLNFTKSHYENFPVISFLLSKEFANKEVPVDFLLKVRNKSVFILDYIRGISEEGKPKYYTWNVVKKDEQELIESFKMSVAKGFPSNYKAELISHPEKAATFEYGANSIKKESESTPDFVF